METTVQTALSGNLTISKFFSNPRSRFALFFTLGAGVTLASGLYSGFHVDGNDFWSSVFYGRAMTLSEPRSWHNGFYPFGYAFIIGQLPYTYVVQFAYAINALLAGLFVASVSNLIAARRSLPAVLLALAVSISRPLIYAYANTPGPDMGAAAFPAFAVYLLWKDSFGEEGSTGRNILPVWVGASLGLGFLWRTHALILAVIMLALAVAFRVFPALSANAKMLAAFAILVSIQVSVDLASGHKAFETAQSFNLYKFLYGMDWIHSPAAEDLEKFSVWNLMLDDPLFVWNMALPYLKNMLSFALPGLAGFACAPKGMLRKFSLFSALCIVAYAIPLSLSDSPRGQLPILGLYIPSLVLLFVILTERVNERLSPTHWTRLVVALVALALFVPSLYQWIRADRSFIVRNRISHRNFLAMEQSLFSRGMKSPDEVFSNKYQVYMPTIPPYHPRQITDWSSNWFWGFSEKYPPLPNDSWESFREACIEQGIQFVILSPSAERQGAFFPAIYERDFDEQEMGIEFLYNWSNMRIYRFIPVDSGQ